MSVSASIEPGRGEYRKTCVPRLLVLGTSVVAFLLVKYVEVNVERVPKFHPGGFESYVRESVRNRRHPQCCVAVDTSRRGHSQDTLI